MVNFVIKNWTVIGAIFTFIGLLLFGYNVIGILEDMREEQEIVKIWYVQLPEGDW